MKDLECHSCATPTTIRVMCSVCGELNCPTCVDDNQVCRACRTPGRRNELDPLVMEALELLRLTLRHRANHAVQNGMLHTARMLRTKMVRVAQLQRGEA